MQIYLLLTEKCNLSCSMCIRGNQSGKDMDFHLLREILDRNNLKCHDVVITGGEPFLHDRFREITEELCKRAKTVTITTNGTINYIDESLLKPNLYFQVSVDGGREAHNSIRGNGTYEKTFETLRLLDKIKTQYIVATVASRKNKASMMELENELHSLIHMKYWRISYEMPFGSAGYDNMMDSYEWNEFVDYMLEYVSLRMRIKKIFPFELYDMNKDKLNNISMNNRCFNCGSGKNKLYVYPDFTVYSCTCLTDFPLGNLENMTIEEITNSKSIRKFSDYQLNDDSICMKCEYKKYCNGGCIGMSYHFFNKLGMGDIRCPKFK